MLEPLPKELQAKAIANALESSSPTSRPSISILGYGVTTKPIVAFLNALGKACAIYDDKPEEKGVEMKNADSSGGGDVENILLDSREFCPESSALEILSPGIPPDHRYFGGARRAISEYDFIWWLENSASGSHSSDFVDFGATADHQSSSAPKSTKSTTSTTANPRILGKKSQTQSENPQKSCREQLEVESTFQQSPTATPRILEEEKQASLSLRGAAEAIHDFSAQVDFMDCHASTSALARNDGNNAASETAPNMSDSQAEAKVDSRSEAQALESTFENTPTTAQNMDSSTAQNLNNSAQDSRILELQIGVFQGEQGDKTSGLSPQRAEEIHDFNPKAESTKKAQSTLPQQSELMYPHSIPENANVLCLGMGLGSGFGCLLEPSFIGDRLCVLDADVFYEHSLLPLLESTSAHNLVLTPHPKEFHALLHLCGLFSGDIAEVARNRFELALCFTQAYKAPTLLLKGANPIIAHNGKLYINSLGTPALAKGGSGDVLSGVIAAYLAQGFSPLASAINASLAHAKAATKEKNTYALTPLRLIEHLGAL